MAAGQKRPILIVGAGVTGLTLACVLRRYGAPVRIVDKLPGVEPHARAIAIHSRTLEVFQDLGVVDAIVERAQKVKAVNQIASGERILHGRYDQLDAPFPFIACLEQWKTETVLEQHLASFGVTVERRTEFFAVEERLDGVRVSLRKEDGSTEVVDTPWLIGCDGAHSAVRHLNRQHFPGEADPARYLIADVVTKSAYPRDEVSFHMTDAGFFGWGPLPEGRTLLAADFDESPTVPDAPPTLADVQALVDARSPERVEISDPRWLGWYRAHYRLTPRYRHGRTFLAGDAAHIHSSIGGQGMNTGIQDAYNLGWKLVLVTQGRSPESLLDSHETERRAIASDVLATTKAATERMLSYSKLPEAERDRVYRHAYVPEADRLKSLRHMAELDLDYRKSPICMEYRHSSDAEGKPNGAPHAGAEAVNAGPLEVEGRRLTTFELLAGPHHTLLLFAGTEGRGRRQANAVDLAGEVARVYGDLIQVCIVLPADAEATALAEVPATIVRDLEGAMHDRYGARAGRSYLIRPDGYVGWCSERPSLTAFRDYLAKVFVCR
jgi:2-polyprenyl-6-methoxyphenol hydroxylase-like FAD-dependent oxidoreductase